MHWDTLLHISMSLWSLIKPDFRETEHTSVTEAQPMGETYPHGDVQTVNQNRGTLVCNWGYVGKSCVVTTYQESTGTLCLVAYVAYRRGLVFQLLKIEWCRMLRHRWEEVRFSQSFPSPHVQRFCHPCIGQFWFFYCKQWNSRLQLWGTVKCNMQTSAALGIMQQINHWQTYVFLTYWGNYMPNESPFPSF